MFEKVLHGGNIAAAFGVVATAADVSFTGGAASAITAALSGIAIFKDSGPETKALAKEMAKLMERELAQADLTENRQRIVTQMLGLYQPSNEDIVSGDMDAATVADSLCAKIAETAMDPAHKTPAALRDFNAIVRATLGPVLSDPAVMTDLAANIYKELLLRTKQSGQGERLRDEGITEKGIIRLAQRWATDAEDVGQAWLELQNAMDVAVRVQQEGLITSNHGDFVDVVIKRVAELAADGAYPDASAEIDAALEQEEATHAARKTRLLESGIEIGRLDNNPEKVTALLLTKLRMEVGNNKLFNQLRFLRREWYDRGRDGGLNFEARVAIHLAEASRDMANGKEQRGTALDDLGTALKTLGERETGTARLDQAVDAYTDALKEWTRDKVPLNWATTQNNLGSALQTLGARETGTARLDQAVDACTEALKERTRDKVPLDWAMTQNNLGNALHTLGERETGTARLDQAVDAYTEALKEWTRDKVPLQWAATQNNLGNALNTLGARETGTARLDQAVEAYTEALKERTRDKVPLDWAMTQNNLGTALQTLGERETGTARLDQAVDTYTEALKERTRDKVPLDWATTQNNLGNALAIFGERETGTARLDQAVDAYTEALKERTRDMVPLDWAMTQNNLCNVEISNFDKSNDAVHLDHAQSYADVAREVFVTAGADYYVSVADRQIARITAARAGLGGA